MYPEFPKKIVGEVSAEEISDVALRLVDTPSPTGFEEQCSILLADMLKEAGLDAKLDYVQEKRPNVLAKLAGEGGGKNLMLYTHIDTIPQGKCWSPEVEAGLIRGRGSADNKGGLAAYVGALKAIRRAGIRLKGDVYLAAGVGHEAYDVPVGIGPKRIASMISSGQIDVDACIVSDGPMDQITVAQGGQAIFKIVVKGEKTTLHSSNIPLSSNPIVWIAKAIDELAQVDTELEARERHPLIAQRPVVQIGQVRGADDPLSDRVPGECEVNGTVRWDPGQNYHDILSRFQRTITNISDEMSGRKRNLRISLDMHCGREECEVSSQEPVVSSLRTAIKSVTGEEIRISGWRIVSDASVFVKEAKVPAVYYGCYKIGKDMTAHTDQESVAINDLEMLAKVYALAALDFCGVDGSYPHVS